jgi:DNA-binding beta-propeller fold protein YncE
MDARTQTVFVSDVNGHQIRRVSLSTANVSTFAGRNGTTAGFVDGYYGRFNGPAGIAYDPVRELLLVADNGNAAIRAVNPSGIIVTVAGNGTQGLADGYGNSTARFMFPVHLAYCETNGNIYVTDAGAHSIRVLSPNGMVRTWVGKSATCGFVDGSGAAARFCNPGGLVCDASGSLLVVDQNFIRKVSPSGIVSTLAGRRSSLFFYQDGTSTVR